MLGMRNMFFFPTVSQNSGFAVEALAGLASKENFSKIELRKSDGASNNNRLEPYLPLMLLHIKGRRKVQCRLVEPSAVSINSGDCYVLVTPDKIIQWLGEYCNVIEKAKVGSAMLVNLFFCCSKERK